MGLWHLCRMTKVCPFQGSRLYPQVFQISKWRFYLRKMRAFLKKKRNLYRSRLPLKEPCSHLILSRQLWGSGFCITSFPFLRWNENVICSKPLFKAPPASTSLQIRSNLVNQLTQPSETYKCKIIWKRSRWRAHSLQNLLQHFIIPSGHLRSPLHLQWCPFQFAFKRQ